MVIKLLGIAVVMISATLIGRGFSECMISRERELANLSDAVCMMKNELTYSLEPIKFIFAKVAPFTKGDVSQLFECIRDYVDGGMEAKEAWEKAITEMSPVLCFKKTDRDFLVGSSDAFIAYESGQQIENLYALKDRIMSLSQEAGEIKKKNCKLVQMLGVYGGVLLCAVLF